jgi:hypothetical protein
VKPYGRHFLIQMDDNGEPDTVARLTQIDCVFPAGVREPVG